MNKIKSVVLIKLLFIATVLLMQNNVLAQDTIISVSGTTYSQLTTVQKHWYDKIDQDSSVSDLYIVSIDTFKNYQDSGRVEIYFPWSNKSAFFQLKDIELYDTSYYAYYQMDFDSSSIDTSKQYYHGYLSFLTTNNTYIGNLSLDEENYSIHYIGGDLHVVAKYDWTNKTVTCSSSDTSSVDYESYYKTENGGTGNNFSCPIRVLALYTDNALSYVGNLAVLEAQIRLAIANTNTSFRNSKIAPNEITLELAPIQNFNFTEGSDIDQDHSFLISELNDQFSDLAQVRDATGSDLVIMFTNGSYGSDVGIAGDFSLDENSAISIVEIDYANIGFTTSHEIGHLFGCRHQLNADNSGDFEHAFKFRAGGGFFGLFEKERETILYTNAISGKKIAHYSNPSVKYKGEKTGDVNDADNARMINATGCLLASYRNWQTAALTAYLTGPYAVCLNEDISISANVSGGATGAYNFNWSYSYDGGINFTSLGSNNSIVSIPGLYLSPTNTGIYLLIIKLVITDQNNTSITRFRTVEVSNQNLGQENPCTHHGFKKEIGDNKFIDKISIFPNPTNNELSLINNSIDYINGYDIKIYDIFGKNIDNYYDIKSETFTFNIQKLVNGFYLVEVKSDNKKTVLTFIKN